MAKTLDRENEFMHLLMKSEGGQRIRGITLLRQLYVISMRWPGHVKTGKYIMCREENTEFVMVRAISCLNTLVRSMIFVANEIYKQN